MNAVDCASAVFSEHTPKLTRRHQLLRDSSINSMKVLSTADRIGYRIQVIETGVRSDWLPNNIALQTDYKFNILTNFCNSDQ